MFLSTLFKTVSCKRYVDLVRKSSSQIKKKKGELIKKLNKENKSLFGKLLETRPQKRKREARNVASTTDQQSSLVGDGSSSEAWWTMQAIRDQYKPASYVVVLKRNTNTNSGVKSDESDRSKEEALPASQNQHNGDSYSKNFSDTSQCSTSLSLHSLNNGDYEISSDNNGHICTSHVADVLEKKNKKFPVLELPDVIVRNIPTFPLLNKNKDSKWIMSVENILNMSSNTEQIRKDYLLYPSVTKVLNATMSDSSRTALKRWRQKMISELGEDGFLNYYRGLLDKGSQFHSAIHNYLSGTPESDLKLDKVEGCWQSLTNVISDVTDVRVLENHVVHSSLLYRGVIDCVAQYKGKPVLIEWKKSDKQKPEIERTYDAPLQLCAYIGAVNYDLQYSFQVQSGLVVVAYSDGSPAHTFNMPVTDCKKYWNLWLLRLQQYWLQQQQQNTV